MQGKGITPSLHSTPLTSPAKSAHTPEWVLCYLTIHSSHSFTNAYIFIYLFISIICIHSLAHIGNVMSSQPATAIATAATGQQKDIHTFIACALRYLWNANATDLFACCHHLHLQLHANVTLMHVKYIRMCVCIIQTSMYGEKKLWKESVCVSLWNYLL